MLNDKRQVTQQKQRLQNPLANVPKTRSQQKENPTQRAQAWKLTRPTVLGTSVPGGLLRTNRSDVGAGVKRVAKFLYWNGTEAAQLAARIALNDSLSDTNTYTLKLGFAHTYTHTDAHIHVQCNSALSSRRRCYSARYLVGVSAIAVAAAAAASAAAVAAAAAELRRRLKSCVLNKNVLRLRSSIHASFSFRRVNFNLKTKRNPNDTRHTLGTVRDRDSVSVSISISFSLLLWAV